MLNANEMEICDGGGLPILITLLYTLTVHSSNYSMYIRQCSISSIIISITKYIILTK